ncbi:MAG: DUF6261 family protein, partial [Dysgonamonadaceae bacterium]|nr:DUF6261 family protein [Dysgonamonadaceae bacterium]
MKAKLVRPKVTHFTNETHFRFHTENSTLFVHYKPESLGITSFFPIYQSAINDENIALERIVKSAETARIAEVDVTFDRTINGMREYNRACLIHYDPAKRISAQNLEVIFDHYGNIGKQAYRSELASSQNLLQDLRAHADDVAAIGLAPWIAAHEEASNALAALLDLRTSENAQQTALRVLETRHAVDVAYQQILDRLEAMV